MFVIAYKYSEIDGKWAIRFEDDTMPIAILATEDIAKEMAKRWNEKEKFIMECAANMEALKRIPKR